PWRSVDKFTGFLTSRRCQEPGNGFMMPVPLKLLVGFEFEKRCLCESKKIETKDGIPFCRCKLLHDSLSFLIGAEFRRKKSSTMARSLSVTASACVGAAS